MKKNQFSCKHNLKNINDLQIVPFEDGLVIDDVLNYFLYLAPSITSIHSEEIDFNDIKLFDEFIKAANIKPIMIMKHYSTASYQKMGLFGDNICIKCNRFILTITQNDGVYESFLESLLRHLRNAIAHGSVYYYRDEDGDFMFFEDKNYRQNLTSRIVLDKKSLELLKSLIEKYDTNENNN